MSDLYSKLDKKVKGQKSKKSKVAKKSKAPKKTSKSFDSSKDFTALKELAGSVKEMSKTLAFGISELDKMIDNFSKKYAKGGVVSDEDRGEAVMVSSEGNAVGELQGVDSGTALVDFSDYDRPPSGDKRGYYPISDLRVVEYDWDKDEYYAKGGETELSYSAVRVADLERSMALYSPDRKNDNIRQVFQEKIKAIKDSNPTDFEDDGEVDIMLTDDDLGYYSILHKGEFIEKDFQSKKEAENWARENNYTYAEGGELKSDHYFNVVYKNVENGDVIVEDEFLYFGTSRDAARKDAKDFLEENKFDKLERLEEEGYGSMDEDEVTFEITN